MKTTPPHERGFVLGIVLIVLFIMLTSTSSVMKQSGLAERIGGNNSERSQAFQASEAALQEAERWIASNTPPFAPFDTLPFTAGSLTIGKGFSTFNPSSSLPLDIDLALQQNQTISVGDRTINPVASTFALPNLARQPLYAIELRGHSCINSNGYAFFNVYSKGWGKNIVSSVSLVSTVRRAINCGTQGAGSTSSSLAI